MGKGCLSVSLALNLQVIEEQRGQRIGKQEGRERWSQGLRRGPELELPQGVAVRPAWLGVGILGRLGMLGTLSPQPDFQGSSLARGLHPGPAVSAPGSNVCSPLLPESQVIVFHTRDYP